MIQICKCVLLMCLCFVVNLPPTLAKSQVSSVRKNMKMHMLSLLKHKASVDYITQITTLLTDLGATNSEVSQVKKYWWLNEGRFDVCQEVQYMYNHWYHAVNVYLILPNSFKTELTSFLLFKGDEEYAKDWREQEEEAGGLGRYNKESQNREWGGTLTA